MSAEAPLPAGLLLSHEGDKKKISQGDPLPGGDWKQIEFRLNGKEVKNRTQAAICGQ